MGAADFDFYFGNVGDKPFTGDFNNNGQDTVGLHRESTGFVYYRDTLTTGNADNQFFFGDPNDQIITGRWAQNPNPGPDTVGIFRPSNGTFYLRFQNSQGNADVSFPYGNSNMAAVAGDFGNLPGGDAPPPSVPPPPTTTTTTIPDLGSGSGNGDNVVSLSLPNTPVVIELTHNGSSNFIVWSLDQSFGKVDLLVNEIGSYSGTRPMQFDASERVGGLEIRADGAWTYEISRLSDQPMLSCGIAGSGDSVVSISNFVNSGGPATLTHNGSSNFIVWAWGFPDRDLLVNEIGNYAGTVLVAPGLYAWDISADGSWTIDC